MIPNCKKEINNLLDFFYLVGIYIETSDASFDPNIKWGGTWVKDTEGLTTVGVCEDTNNQKVKISLGEIKGETNHSLTSTEIPQHGGHTDTWNGSYTDMFMDLSKVSSIFTKANMSATIGRGWSIQASNEIVPNTKLYGGSSTHNNVQPSIGVIRWHRIS